MTDQPTLLPWPASLTAPTGNVFVPGVPIPQGSHKAFIIGGHAKVTESNKALNPWRADVHAALRTLIGNHIPIPEGPVAVDLAFTMPRRKTEPKRRTPPHTRKPDIDKLTRGILDAMTGLVFTDDAQVTYLRCTKHTAPLGDQPGVLITWRPTA